MKLEMQTSGAVVECECVRVCVRETEGRVWAAALFVALSGCRAVQTGRQL